jgi:bacteriocin biosynthesis cyclodehydratase domain-containing protein
MKQPDQKLKSVPVQFIKTDNGVILKRGCTEVKIGGEGTDRVLRILFAATSSTGSTKKELLNLFSPSSHELVARLIDELVRRRLLTHDKGRDVGKEESGLDLFYWHFGVTSEDVNRTLNERNLVICGVNTISGQLATSLYYAGCQNVRVLDDPRLRNLRLYDNSGRLRSSAWPGFLPLPESYETTADPASIDCLITTSDFGSAPALAEWNKFCIENNRCYLPVFIKNLIGYIGPLVIPGETACFQCLYARQNANLENPDSHLVVDSAVFDSQHVLAFHPSIATIVAEVAMFELMKFYSRAMDSYAGSLIEVNLLALRLRARRVLKIPRCHVCSPLTKASSTTATHSYFSAPKEPVE